MDNPSDTLDPKDLTRRPRTGRPRTDAWRRSVRAATKRWRKRHPAHVAKWQQEWRMRVRAWKAILETGVRSGDLKGFVDELALRQMAGSKRYSEYETLIEAYGELCVLQGDACKLCRRPYALEHAARYVDGGLWGMVCGKCATYMTCGKCVHKIPKGLCHTCAPGGVRKDLTRYAELVQGNDAIATNATQPAKLARMSIEDYLGTDDA